METKELAKVGSDSQLANVNAPNMLSLNLNQIKGLATVMVQSGMFKDIQNAYQAYVKILAGQEMGIAPFQAMSDIHIIQGKATAGGNIYASKVKMHPKYDYKVKAWTSKGCAIEFYQIARGKVEILGTSQFDENDAKEAGLAGKGPWVTYARNMYFNRAMTNGVRTFCPDVLGGVGAYTPEEMGDQSFIEAEKVEDEVVTEVPDKKEEPKKTTEQAMKDGDDMPEDFLKDEVVEPTQEQLDGAIDLGEAE